MKLQPTPDEIIEMVANLFGLKVKEIHGSCRAVHIAHPRQISMYLMRERLELSLERIGWYIGNRDHTTVLHGVRSIKRQLLVDSMLKARIDLLNKDLDTLCTGQAHVFCEKCRAEMEQIAKAARASA